MSDEKSNPAHEPKIFSEEEIEMFLAGDRRQIDRHILYSLNRLAAVLIPHVTRDKEAREKIAEIGGFEAIERRAEFVDSLIKRNNRISLAMEKISQSAITWALIAFLGFLATSVWHDIVSAMKAALKVKGAA